MAHTTVVAAKGANERDLNPTRQVDPAKHKIAFYHADMMPPPDAAAPVPVDRKAALAAKAVLETPQQAHQRIEENGQKPSHYIATPLVGDRDEATNIARGPYKVD